MSAINGFSHARSKRADLNMEAVELAAKVQANFQELGG